MEEKINKIFEMMCSFQLETTRNFNRLSDEIKECRLEIQKSREIEDTHWKENLRRWEENNKRWDENDKRWDENDKRWDENDKRWEENNKHWEENNKRWEENKKLWDENKKLWKENHLEWQKYRENRIKDKKDLLDILLRYDISISKQLGDPNAEKMQKIINN